MIDLGEFYRGKVEGFLKTVVCFDDKAFFSPNHMFHKGDKTATKLSDGFSQPTIDKEAVRVATKSNGDETNDAGTSILDARKLTEAFAEKGMLCSVIIPNSEAGEMKKQIQKLAAVADVSILDWKLGEEDTSTARDAILEIVSQDNKTGGRLRLVIVYSIGNGKDIIDELHGKLKDQEFSLDQDSLVLRSKHALIAFFQKPDTIKPTGPVVKYEELPDRAVREFSKLTAGLLPAAALTAISEIRKRTHHLLATFPAMLDGAFLAHRCLIPDPNDSEQFLLDLIVAEIGTLLDSGSVKSVVEAAPCKAWLGGGGYNKDQNERLEKALCEFSRDKCASLKKLFVGDNLSNMQTAEKLIELFYKAHPQELEESKERLSTLATLDAYSTHTSRGQGKPPRLRLGSVVKRSSDSQYLLCIQPLCDAVRIKDNKDTLYPFLILSVTGVHEARPNLDLCIPEEKGSGVTWLAVVPKPNNIISYPFRAKSKLEAFVDGKLEGGAHIFETATDPRTTLRWVADLKIGKAQRIVSELAARIHMLGIEEFEWMRLHQSRGG